MSWFDEVRRAEGSPKETASLLDLEWYRERWSRSDYLSVPASETEVPEEVESSEEIEVSALIYEVDDNYVFSDDQYAEVLRGLRDRAEEDASRASRAHSQTSGAGPSHKRPTPKVTVEEVSEPEEYYDDDYSSTFHPRASELGDVERKENVYFSDTSVAHKKGKDKSKKKNKKKQRKSK
jgi:hypothetical protein